MQAPQLQNQNTGLSSVTMLWQLITLAVGVTALVLVSTQNLDMEYSAKEVKTKVHYRGNLFVDLKNAPGK